MARPIAARRHDEILKTIETTGTVSVEELSRVFGVSRETVRRDLKALAERGRVDVVHGGAARREIAEAALGQRSRENVEGKAAIGRAAGGLVEDGMVVLLDSGTTTLAIASSLTTKKDLTVCTNSLAIAQVLCRVPSTRVHILGEEIDPTDESAVGLEVVEALQSFRVDVAFIGAGGLSEAGIVTDYTRVGAEQRARMLAAAERGYFVLDRSKFGRLAPLRIRNADLAAGFIVDVRPPRPVEEALASRGVRLIVAEFDR